MVESAISFTSEEVATYYAARVPHLQQRRAAEWRGACPIHHGKNDNFAVEPGSGRWFCHSTCGRGGDILELEAALSGGDFPTRKAAIFSLVGRVESDCRRNCTRTDGHSAGMAPAEPTKPVRVRIAATYQYVDAGGSLLYEVVRWLMSDGDKEFQQRRPDGRGGWLWNLDGIARVPYRLPRLLAADTVYLPEGERDVHTLEEWGLAASCNSGGSGGGSLYAGWLDYFRGRHLVVLPDNDGPGQKHAAAVAAALLSVAASVSIVELPGLPAKGDVTDWRDAGGTFERFRELTEVAPVMDASTLAEVRGRWALGEDELRHPARAGAGSLITRRMSDVNAKPVNWLWPRRIARGKVSIIAGNPGLGKSQVTASIAAIVTTGGRWPVDRSQCTPGDVVFLSAEDDPADTLRPRLEAAGANLQRVHCMDAVILGYSGEGQQQNRAFSLQRDLEGLSVKLTELGDVAAVVIDPITAYLGDVDSHRNAEVRALLAPLSEIAAKHGTAIIGISHMNKSVGTEALMRVTGSLAFVAAARAAYLVAQDPGNPARRLFLPMKNNIGPDSEGLAFRIEAATVQSAVGPLQTSLVVWDSEPATTTADEVMRTQVPEHGSALRDAEEWLREELSEPAPATEISRMAANAGISRRTLQRASESLGIIKGKAGMRAGWMWSLPANMTKSFEEAQPNSLDTFGNLGHLRDTADVLVEVEL
jgi:putative DNA primase/helicase